MQLSHRRCWKVRARLLTLLQFHTNASVPAGLYIGGIASLDYIETLGITYVVVSMERQLPPARPPHLQALLHHRCSSRG